jgi:uncharacterized protein
MATEHANIFKTPAASDPILPEVVRRLVETYRPEQIYLFGSVARRDAGPDSDYDLMVFVPDHTPAELKVLSLATSFRGTGAHRCPQG